MGISLGLKILGINTLASSLLGIYYFMFQWMKGNKEASRATKLSMPTVLVLSTFYELKWQRKIKTSSLKWHYLHMFVTHVGLSLMPPMIAWYYYPHINLLALPWT